MSEKDGGAAFPIQGYENGIFGGANVIHHQGMKLRDYFAAQAIAMAHKRGISVVPFGRKDELPQEIAQFCYAVADAMLAERAKS